MTLLRRTLQQQGRLVEAQQLVKNEAKLQERESLVPFIEIIPALETIESQRHEALLIKAAWTRIFFASQIAEVGDKSEAQSFLATVEAMMKTCFGHNWERGMPCLKAIIDRIRLNSMSTEPPEDLVQRYLDLAIRAEGLPDYPTTRACLQDAYSYASKLANQEQPPSLQASTKKLERDLLLKYLSFEAEQAKSAFYVSAILPALLLELSKEFKSGQVLEVIQDFERQFPEFDNPNSGERIMFFGANESRILGDVVRETEYKLKSQKFREQCPFVRRLENGDRVLKEVDDQNFFQEWTIPPAFPLSDIHPLYKVVSATILRRWVLVRFKDGYLSEDEIRAFLHITRREGRSDVEHVLIAITPEELSQKIYGMKSPLPSIVWDPWFEMIVGWLKGSTAGPSQLQRHHLLKQISICRMSSVSRFIPDLRSFENEQWKLKERRKHLALLLTLDIKLINPQEIRTMKSVISSSVVSCATLPNALKNGYITMKMLDEAQSITDGLVEEWKALGDLQRMFQLQARLVKIAWQKYLHFQRPDALNEALRYLRDQDDTYRSIRSDNSLLYGSRSFFARHLISEKIRAHEMYSGGIRTSLVAWNNYCTEHKGNLETIEQRLENQEFQELAREMIKWMQKSKSRALTDLLGLEISIPTNFQEHLLKSEEAKLMTQRRRALLERIAEASMSRKLPLRRELRSLENEMRKHKTLKPIMDIIDGASLESKDIIEMGQYLGSNVIFVDFIQVLWIDAWNLAMVIYRGGAMVAVEILSMKLREVDGWVADQMDSDTPLSIPGATRQLRPLDQLVKPLENFTEPSEVLVLVPTQSLHRVPLHALVVGGQLLIERNPIVYSQSLTLLKHCFTHTWIDSPAKPMNSAVINPLQDELKTAEAGKAITTLLGSSLPDTTSWTKQQFIDYMKPASIIHFHGHVQFTENEPLRHHLELRPKPLSDDDILTADEIFDLRLSHFAHVTTIGCSSGRAKVSTCDDLLGLTAAFHYAGASSVVSALWPIHRDDGSRFSLKFYECWIEQLKESVVEEDPGSKFVNLVVAMQRAVLWVRRDEEGNIRVPYHWAGFTLSGSWLIAK